MVSARPAFQLELRASDHYLVLLGGALLGYAVLGKSLRLSRHSTSLRR